MTNPFDPRPYQREAIAALRQGWAMRHQPARRRPPDRRR